MGRWGLWRMMIRVGEGDRGGDRSDSAGFLGGTRFGRALLALENRCWRVADVRNFVTRCDMYLWDLIYSACFPGLIIDYGPS